MCLKYHVVFIYSIVFCFSDVFYNFYLTLVPNSKEDIVNIACLGCNLIHFYLDKCIYVPFKKLYFVEIVKKILHDRKSLCIHTCVVFCLFVCICVF